MSANPTHFSSPDHDDRHPDNAPRIEGGGRPRAVFMPGMNEKPACDWMTLTMKAAPFILLHLLALVAFWTPLTVTAVVLFCVTYAVRVFGLTGGYHRYFAHRAYSMSRVFQFMLAWMGAMAVQKGPLWWAGHHRSHHRYSDTPKDPHSPYETTFWWSHVGWILSNEHTRTPHEDIQDFSRFPELRLLDVFHWVPGVLLAVACYLIGGWPGLVYGFLLSTIAVYHVTFAINSLNHLMGSRRYATDDDSRNNVWLALVTFGEGWHNNHHYFGVTTLPRVPARSTATITM
jgi:stearoyl-CoA desaturase (Delta-9 desaturase)